MDLKIELDLEKMKQEATESMKRNIKERLDKQIGDRLIILFHNPNDQGMTQWFQRRGPEPDLSLAYQLCEQVLADFLLGDQFTIYATQYLNQHFHKHVDAALDKAMEHRAGKMAFEYVDRKVKEAKLILAEGVKNG